MASRPDGRRAAPARLGLLLALILAPLAPAQDLPTTLPDRARPIQPEPETQPQPAPRPAEERPAVQPAPARTTDPDQESDPGRKLILQASRAVRDLNSLSYRSKFYGTGPIEQVAPRGEGVIRMARSERNERVWLQHATGTGVAKPGDSELNFDVAWLEVMIEWVDHTQKKVVVRPVRQAKGAAYQVAGAMRLLELLEATPLAKEVQAETFTLEDPAEVDGVPCQVVLVTLAGGRTRSRWWIADADHLPRKMARLFTGPNGSGEIVVELSEVTPNPALEPAALRVAVPAGYTRDEAPSALTPPNSSRPSTTATPAPENPAATPPPVPTIPAAPSFELTSATGEKVTLASLSGHVVVLQFWGTWHLPSRAACADLQALARQFEGQRVKFFAASVRERSDEAPREFIRSAGYTFGLLLNADQAAQAYGVVRFPTFEVIGTNGERLKTIVGYKKDETLKQLTQAINDALGPPAQAATTPGR